MDETQQIPWKRLSIEAAAIIASILLAFSIDAWWEDRQERQFERETLLALKSEYEDHKQLIGNQIEFHLMSLRAIASLMSACQHGSYESVEFTIDEAIYVLQVPVTTDLGSGVRDALISAGRVEAIQDVQLRYELSAWDSVVDELTDGQQFNRNMVREIVFPQLIEIGLPLSKAMDRDGTPWPVPTESISKNSDGKLPFLTDPKFCSMLDIRYGHMNHTADEYVDLKVAIDEILGQIERSLNL